MTATRTRFSAAALGYFARHAIDPNTTAALGVTEQPAGTLVYPDGRRRPLDGNRTFQPKGKPLAAWWLLEPEHDPVAIVCEGESDSLAAATHLPRTPDITGLRGYGVVCLPGAAYPARQLVADLSAKGVTAVYLAYDGDDAGRNATAKAAEALSAAGIRAMAVPVPAGHDLSDALAEVDDPPAELAALIADARPATRDFDREIGRPDDYTARIVRGVTGPTRAPGTSHNGGPAAREVVLRPAASIEPCSPRFAFKGRVPLGLVTILAGREGLGKSSVTIELGAQGTRGELAGDLEGEPFHVVYASGEDSPHTTLVPRLMAAGADLERVSILEVVDRLDGERVPGVLTLPEDLPRLAAAVVAAGARMLVLDPLVGYLGAEVNAHRDQDVRRVLAPLARLAADHDIAVLGIMHLNKGDTTDVLSRVSGSVGFTASARSVLAFARDPEDPQGESGPYRVLAHAKCNVGPLAPSLRARIEPRKILDDHGDPLATSRVVILEETSQTARDLLEQPANSEERTARDEAADFLRAELADGPIPTPRLKTAAGDAGLSWRTVERAKSRVGAKAVKTSSGWQWELNTATPTPAAAVGGLVGLPTLEPNKTATNTAKAAKAATANGIGGRGDLDFCACRVPARSPRAEGPDVCATCRRPMAGEGAA